MGASTGIAWTDATFNPWWGCTKISAGCANCYAEQQSSRYGHNIWGAGVPRRTMSDGHWQGPVSWNAEAVRTGVRRRVFCASMADIGDPEAPAGAIDRLWDLIRRTPMLDWQLLTKRPERYADILPADWGPGYRNVWLGTTVENQAARQRITTLLQTPAVLRFLSCEPLLEAVDLSPWMGRIGATVDWIIVGGESGPQARPMDEAWVTRIAGDAERFRIPLFVKQMGAVWARKQPPGKLHDRRAASELVDMPESLRIRCMPVVPGTTA